MQRIAGMTVSVKADGVNEAFYNGQRDRVVEAIRQEMVQQKEQLEAELAVQRDRADIQTRTSNRLRKSWLNAFVKNLTRRRGPIWRVKNAVATVWAYIWALTIGGVWIEMGERLGLWERIEEDEDGTEH